MSQQASVSQDKREECLAKSGLPSWYDDGGLIKPQQALDPERLSEYHSCMNSSFKNPLYQLKNTSKQRKTTYVILGVVGVVTILKVAKIL